MAISAVGAGLSGMQSYQRALDVSANNVANSLTRGFQPSKARFQEVAQGGSAVSVSAPTRQTGGSQAAGDMPSNTDLNTEVVDQQVYKTGFQLSAKVIKTSDQMLGTLLDTKA